jgi:hypothetical protein
MIMKLKKSEAKAQVGCRASEKKASRDAGIAVITGIFQSGETLGGFIHSVKSFYK